MLRQCQVVVVVFFANGGEVTVEKFLDQTDLSLEKEKENFCTVLTNSIERAREIRKFHVAVVQRRLRNVARKKRDARAKLLFC